MASPDPAAAAAAPVDPDDFYALLGVPKDAETKVIRKAYHKLALTCHPDKHPDDPNADAKFKAISEAYEVLSDETKRETYDKYGKAGLEGGMDMDLGVVLKMLFGAGEFDELIGELSLGMMLDPECAGMEAKDLREKCDLHQKEQQQQLVAKLREKLAGHHTDKKAWLAKIEADLVDKLEAPGGSSLLFTIGYVYEQEAKKHSGKFFGLGAAFAEGREKVHNLKQGVKQAFAVVSLQAEMERMEKEGVEGAEKDAKMTTATMGMFFTLGIAEAEDTARAVANAMLEDKGLSKEEGKCLRASLADLGAIYRKAGKAYMAQEKKAMKEMQKATLKEEKRAAGSSSSSSLDTSSGSTPQPPPDSTVGQSTTPAAPEWSAPPPEPA